MIYTAAKRSEWRQKSNEYFITFRIITRNIWWIVKCLYPFREKTFTAFCYEMYTNFTKVREKTISIFTFHESVDRFHRMDARVADNYQLYYLFFRTSGRIINLPECADAMKYRGGSKIRFLFYTTALGDRLKTFVVRYTRTGRFFFFFIAIRRFSQRILGEFDFSNFYRYSLSSNEYRILSDWETPI